MPLTYAEVIDKISTDLDDTTNLIFTDPFIASLILDGLVVVSNAYPRIAKTTLTTAASRDITLTTENLRNLLPDKLENRVEYTVDQDPPVYKNFTLQRNVLSLLVTTVPEASESVYIWLTKKHILNELGTSDTAGAVKTTAAAGVSSIVLKSLGTGTINEDSTLTIAGDATTYTVTAKATIAANEATVSITPVLAAQATADVVVTLVAPASTLDPNEESLLCQWVEAMCMLRKASLNAQYRDDGKLLLAIVNQKLNVTSACSKYTVYSRD